MNSIGHDRKFTVALDAMGGDQAPVEQVKGAVLAAKEHGIRVLLVGQPSLIKSELASINYQSLPLEIIPAEDIIREGESPAKSIRLKPNSSISVATRLVNEGLADAAVTMGSTGAAMASSVLAFGLFPGLQRPAIGGAFIKLAPKTTIMDLGAQIDSRPAQLLSTAVLGCTFSRVFMDIANPRVGILSVGTEEGKGNSQVRATYPLLQTSGLNFVGNVEAHEIFQDRTDVLICDGFVGNILLKFTEGLADAIAQHLQSAPDLNSSLIRNFPGFADNAENSSGPLFGVNGVMIIGHGRTEAIGVARAIVRANEALNLNLVEIMRNELELIMKTTKSGADLG